MSRRKSNRVLSGEPPAEPAVLAGRAGRGRWRRNGPWLVAAAVVLIGAALAGLLTAYLVATMRAAPPPDAALLPTPTPLASPSGSPTAAPPVTAQPRPSASPAPSGPTPEPTPSPSPFEYVVEQGDSITRIAARFLVTPESIIALNNLRNPDLIVPDQVLLIPGAPNVTPAPSP